MCDITNHAGKKIPDAGCSAPRLGSQPELLHCLSDALFQSAALEGGTRWNCHSRRSSSADTQVLGNLAPGTKGQQAAPSPWAPAQLTNRQALEWVSQAQHDTPTTVLYSQGITDVWLGLMTAERNTSSGSLPVGFPPKRDSHMFLCECAQSCLTLCDPVDGSPPGSSVHGVLQTRILEWVVISSSTGSSQSRDGTHISCISCTGRLTLYHSATCEAHNLTGLSIKLLFIFFKFKLDISKSSVSTPPTKKVASNCRLE